MKRIVIGLTRNVRENGLHRSIESIFLYSRHAANFVLLGSDAIRSTCSGYENRFPHLYTPGRYSGDMFNLLLTAGDYDIFVLLEAGIVLGPCWLDEILSIFQSDKRAGAVGPSSNQARGVQNACSASGSSPDALMQAARTLRAALPYPSQELERGPEDFCYVIRGEAARDAGPASIAGPDFTDEYNHRLRARGYRNYWACASVVFRRAAAAVCEPIANRSQRPAAQMTTGGRSAQPLVSCILPTRERAEMLERAVRCFDAQSYTDRELIIVFESDADLPEGLAGRADIRLVRVKTGLSIGMKRNVACNIAQGPIVAQWDDDDWFAPERLRAQVDPILSGQVDITALQNTLFFDEPSQRFWRCSPELYRTMFVEGVHGGTLVFLRDVWCQLARYPDTSLREDADFLLACMRKGARLGRVDGHNLYVYVRHRSNSWKFQIGTHGSVTGWTLIPRGPVVAGELSRASSGLITDLHAVHDPPGQPLVSCIMPTRDRPAFASKAIEQFLSQDYAHKELVILDNGEEKISGLIPQCPSIHYLTAPSGPVGALRNTACAISSGNLISHWDDDDWRAPEWLTHQVQTMLVSGADVCGSNPVLFREFPEGRAWRYTYPADIRPWVCGGTLCYRRAWWERHPFTEIATGEDTLFIWGTESTRIANIGYTAGYVATVHAGNTSPKVISAPLWVEIPAADVEALIQSVVESR